MAPSAGPGDVLNVGQNTILQCGQKDATLYLRVHSSYSLQERDYTSLPISKAELVRQAG